MSNRWLLENIPWIPCIFPKSLPVHFFPANNTLCTLTLQYSVWIQHLLKKLQYATILPHNIGPMTPTYNAYIARDDDYGHGYYFKKLPECDWPRKWSELVAAMMWSGIGEKEEVVHPRAWGGGEHGGVGFARWICVIISEKDIIVIFLSHTYIRATSDPHHHTF